MPKLNACLSLDGNCAEAMTFHAKVLDAKLEALISHEQAESQMQMPCPPGQGHRIMHAYLVHPQFELMAGDTPPGMAYQGLQGVMMTLTYLTAAEGRRAFDALATGGTVTMPLGEAFWADVFGMVTDRYGVPWGVNGGLPRAEREAVVAALNGLVDDHLAATGNPLAITMALRRRGLPLALERATLRLRMPEATPRVLVLLHGLCMNDLQWQRDGHAHGVALASSAGYAPAYLHYNSGLSVSTNDRVLAHLMERPVDAWPVPIERLTLLGHSMGGLLAHSALHHGALVSRGSLRWPARVTEMVSLDTPHQGTPLERAGQSVDLPLGAAPYAAPLARIGKIRSAGIRDLRHGEIVLGGKNESETHGRTPASLPDTARCFAIAGCLGPPGRSLKGPLLGDGLVPVASALGQHRDPALRLAFHNERQAVVHETGHLELLSSTKVTAILTRWLA